MTTAEEAFNRAAMCADQAQTARDEETRTFFNRLRDSWVRVANNYQSRSRWRQTSRHLAQPAIKLGCRRIARLLRRSRTSNTEDAQLEKVARSAFEIASYGADRLARWAGGRQPNRPRSNYTYSATASAGVPAAGGNPIPWGRSRYRQLVWSRRAPQALPCIQRVCAVPDRTPFLTLIQTGRAGTSGGVVAPLTGL